VLIAKTAQLFTPGETGLEKVSAHWLLTKDGDATAIRIFERHYSFQRYRDNRLRRQFVGPGQKLVLITADGDALFVWRLFKSGDHQEGVNCAVFRNEGSIRSRLLILEAEAIAHKRWPGSRFYTYVDPEAIESEIPGYCFIRAGWKKCGITIWNKLVVLEKRPKVPKPRHRGFGTAKGRRSRRRDAS
jgi:hypothetical protein